MSPASPVEPPEGGQSGLRLRSRDPIAPPPVPVHLRTKEGHAGHLPPPSPVSTGGGSGVVRFRSAFAWLLFFALGGAMAALRYGEILDLRTEITAYGPYIVLGLHVLIIVLAFREEFFLGVLCLFIPGYSLIYLLFQSGRAFLCAIVFGLLIGLGEDSFYAFRDIATEAQSTVSEALQGDR